MNYSQYKYTHEEVLKHLISDTRKIHYEFTVHNNEGRYLGSLNNCEGKISFDASKSVMRTFSGTAMKNEILDINYIDERVIPWFCININGDILKFPLGNFVISPRFSCDGVDKQVDIVGYDFGKIILDDKITSRLVRSSGNFYTNEVQEILSEIYPLYYVETSDKIRMNDYEWSPGTSKLQIINDTLTSLNYYPIYFDEYGTPCCKPYIFPESQSIEMYYKIGKNSIVLSNASLESNRFDVPNKFVRYVENVDSEYMISSYTNDDPNNKYSTVSRKRVISDVQKVSDISSQQELDNYVKRCAAAAMSVTDTLIFRTLNMPGHNFKNCLYVEVDGLNIREKLIEIAWEMELKVGAEMIHRCTRVVNVE